MTPALAIGLWMGLAVYLGIGVLFALAFVTFAVQRLDPAAHGMPVSARLLVLPGATVLWPLLCWKWLRRQGPPAA